MVEGATSSTLIRWIPLLPLGGAVIQTTMLFVARRPVRRSWVIVLSMVPTVAAFLFACVAFAELIGLPSGSRAQYDVLWSWVGLGVGSEAFSADLSFLFDTLSGAISLVVLAVSLLVFLYAIAFMDGDTRPDAGYQRFFAYMGFALSSVLVLVLAENLLILLAGWIGAGIATAALIGFWYSDPRSKRAAVRNVVLSTAVDALLIGCSVLLFWSLAGTGAHTSSFDEVEAGLHALAQVVITLPFGLECQTLTLLGLGFGLAACSRAAQLPFYFSLSGISRSPAPAAAFSVLAASMGIYLCCRLSFLFAQTPAVSAALAWAGGLTAVFAAASALAQRDLVAILVASSVSQFGIAFLAIGSGAYSAAIFQLVMTAIVMTLLILCAGAVIHCLEGERDIRRMGGLDARLVLTHLMAVIGVFSPAFFLSREQAIAAAFEAQHVPGSKVLYGLALVATLLVSWAISRYLVGVFWGSIRTPLGFRGEFADPPLIFMLPMYGLALLSVIGVAVNPAQIWGDLLPGGVEGSESLGHFLGGVLVEAGPAPLEPGPRWQLVAGSLLATLIGLGVTYLYYVRFPRARAKLNTKLAPLHDLLESQDPGGLLERWIALPLIALSRALFKYGASLRASFGWLRATRFAGAKGVFGGASPPASRLALSQLYSLVMLAGALIMLMLVTR